MSWGHGQSNGWGNSTWSRHSSEEETEPNGQHHNRCIAEYHGWNKQGPMSSYYDAKCPGCERDRASKPWGASYSNKGNGILKGVTALVGGAIVVKKGIWD